MEDKPAGAPTKRRQSRDPVLNRERLLSAAQQLFATQGVAATTMKQIAQAAEVGPGTLYRHFTDKSALCTALMEDNFAGFQQRVAVIIEEGEAAGSNLRSLERLLDEMIVLLVAHVPLLRAIQEGGTQRNHQQGPVYSWVYSQLTRVLQAAVVRGEVSNLDVEYTADAILAVLMPPLFDLQQQRGFSPERITAGARRLFIDGLRAPTSSPQ